MTELQCSSTFLALDSDFFLGAKIRTPTTGALTLRHFPYNENSPRLLKITSVNCRLPSTKVIYRGEKIHAFVSKFKVASCEHASLESTYYKQLLLFVIVLYCVEGVVIAAQCTASKLFKIYCAPRM